MSNIDPWQIIGWLLLLVLVGWLGLTIGRAVLASVGLWLLRWYFHLTTRNTPPAKGQFWDNNNGSTVRIERIGQRDDGSTYIVVKAGCVSWGDSPESWRERVRGRRMYLISESA